MNTASKSFNVAYEVVIRDNNNGEKDMFPEEH